MRKYFKLLIAVALFVGKTAFCQDSTQIIQKELVGKWCSMDGADTILIVEFCPDGKRKAKSKLIPFELEEGYFDDYHKKWIEYEVYKVEKIKNEYYLNIYSPDDDFLLKNKLYYHGNNLIGVSIKWWIDDEIEQHIDEVLHLRRITPNANYDKPIEFNSHQYYLPKNYRGKFYIVYNQDFGVEEEKDEMNCTVFRIPETGILYTKSKADPERMVLGKQEFYLNRSEDKSTEKIGSIPYVISDKKAFEQVMSSSDSIYVLSNGFNQQGRGALNRTLGKEINGNVEFFEVITKSEIIKRYKDKGYL